MCLWEEMSTVFTLPSWLKHLIIFLMMSLKEQTFKVFDSSIIFPLIIYTFSGILKSVYCNIAKDFILCCLLNVLQFKILCLWFTSNRFYMVRGKLLFLNGYLVVPTAFEKSFPIELSWHLCWKSVESTTGYSRLSLIFSWSSCQFLFLSALIILAVYYVLTSNSVSHLSSFSKLRIPYRF